MSAARSAKVAVGLTDGEGQVRALLLGASSDKKTLILILIHILILILIRRAGR